MWLAPDGPKWSQNFEHDSGPYTGDWKPPGSQDDFWEPVFHPALANESVHLPGAGGSARGLLHYLVESGTIDAVAIPEHQYRELLAEYGWIAYLYIA